MPDEAASAAAHPERPAPRYPEWIVSAGPVPEVRGSGVTSLGAAKDLVSRSVAFVWRQCGLAPEACAVDLTDHDLASATVDTNVSTRADRKFVYYSPERLKAGP